jgi:aryl-alcohol dehydrogenase-like predicted oxidoreductase
MEKRTLGSTGWAIMPFALGGNVFGWTAHGADAFHILDRFVEYGGELIDTADVYSAWMPEHSGGESEELIGQWLQRRGRRDDVIIATKVGLLAGAGGKGLQPARIRAAVEESLQRLQTDYIDLYFAHADDPATPLGDSLEAFDQLVKEGKVRTLGASQYTPGRIAKALSLAKKEGLEPFRVVQPELNLVNRDAYLGDLQRLCRDENLGVVTYFSLAAGFLTGKYRDKLDLKGRARAGRVREYLNGEGLEALAALDAVVADTGGSHAQVALAWIIAQEGVTAPIASATSVAQLEDLMGAMQVTLRREHLTLLNGKA